jgi:hypothetical protein
MATRGSGLLLLLSAALAPQIGAGQTRVPPPETQIAAARLAAPEALRDGVTVLGFDASGSLVILQSGENELVCLADSPGEEGFSVACYHRSLEPYMARGRELVAQGVSDGGERNRIRWREATQGVLDMPEEPATLYVLTGKAFDPERGTVVDPYLRWVFYVPWATVESTGLSARPTVPGAPWLMFPGTPGAHIMISPPRPPGE